MPNILGEPREFEMQVAWGLLQGFTRVVMVGNNPAAPASTSVAAPQDIWSGGGAYPWMTALTSLEVLSSSAADAAAGTGCQTVTLAGLDDSYNPINQVIALNGVTPVAIPRRLFRINGVVIASAGSGLVNAGTITVRDAGGGTTRAIMPIGYGQTRQTQYTVPAGSTLLVTDSIFTLLGASSGVTSTLATYIAAAGSYRLPIEINAVAGTTELTVKTGIPLPGGTDFGHRCTAVNPSTVSISSGWVGVLRASGAQ